MGGPWESFCERFGLPQPAHEATVGNAMLSGSCIDASDPQLSELSFSFFAATICISVSSLHGLARHRAELASSAGVAFGSLENASAFFVRGNTALYSGHGFLSSVRIADLRSEIGQQTLDPRDVGFGYLFGASQLSLPLRRLARQNVALVRLMALDFSAPSTLEALGCAAV